MPKVITTNSSSSGSDIFTQVNADWNADSGVAEILNKPDLYTKAEVDEKVNTYTHVQSVPSATWTITHNLGKKPSVTITDSTESVVVGDITYNSENQITVSFSGGFSGKAYLN